MINTEILLHEIPIEERNNYNHYLPRQWRKSVKDIVGHGHVTSKDLDQHKTVEIGFKDIINGLGLYYKSETLVRLLKHSEETTKPWDKTSMYIAGGIGSQLSTCFAFNIEEQKTFPWQLKLAGQRDMYTQTDIDIYLDRHMEEFVKSNFKFTERKSRTVKGLTLLETSESIGGNNLRFQFHCFEDNSLSPIAHAVLLAPTCLNAVGIAINGPIFSIIDPFGAYERSREGDFTYLLDNQKLPMHLIDRHNPLCKNSTRVISGLMIYCLVTPKISEKYSRETKRLKVFVSKKIDDLNDSAQLVILEKFKEWSSRTPYTDIINTLEETPINLAKIGLLKPLIQMAIKHNDEEALSTLIFRIALCAKYVIKHPKAIQMDIDENEIFYPLKKQREILDIAAEIDWENIFNSN